MVLLVLLSPRFLLFLFWLFDYSRFKLVFHGNWLWPILGFIFLPFTTLAYFLFYSPVLGHLSSWGWFWVIIGLILDIGSYGISGRGRGRMGRPPAAASTTTDDVE